MMNTKAHKMSKKRRKKCVYLVEEEYLVTALVPSDTACLASSPGRISRTDVWISRDEMVDFLLYAASLDASVATRSKMSLTKEFKIDMARLEIPVSGCTCLRTAERHVSDGSMKAKRCIAYPCRYTSCRSLSWSSCASSCRQMAPRSSYQPPSSQQVLYRQAPCQRWSGSAPY